MGKFGFQISVEGEQKFKTALMNINANAKLLKSEINLMSSSFDKNDNSIEKLTAHNKILTTQIDNEANRIAILNEKLKINAAEFGEDSVAVKSFETQINTAQANLNNLERQFEENTQAIENGGKALTDFGNEAKGAGEKAITTFKLVAAHVASNLITDGIHRIGDGFKKLGAISIDSAKFIVKTGMEYESVFAGVIKTVDATDSELAKLSGSLRDMSTEIPVSAAGLADLAAMAGQLGIAVPKIGKFTKVIANMGVATNLAGEEGAAQMAKFANIVGMSQDNFENLGSSIVALGNKFPTTEADIINMSMRIAGAGAQAKMSSSDILALATAASSVGIEAEMGGSAISKMLVAMQSALETGTGKIGAKDIKISEFAAIADMTTGAFKKLMKANPSEAFSALLSGLKNAESQGASTLKMLENLGISEVRLRDTMLRLSGASDVLTDALDISGIAWDENTALAKEAETRYATLESKLGMLKNSVTDFGIAIYQSTDGALGKLVDLGKGYMVSLTDAYETGGLAALSSQIDVVVEDILNRAMSHSGEFVDMAGTLLDTFLNATIDNLPKITDASLSIISRLSDTVSSNNEQIATATSKIILGIGDELIAATPTLVEGAVVLGGKIAWGLVTRIDDGIGTLAKSATKVLNNISGVWENLTNKFLGFVFPKTFGGLDGLSEGVKNFNKILVATGITVGTYLVGTKTLIANNGVLAVTQGLSNYVMAVANIEYGRVTAKTFALTAATQLQTLATGAATGAFKGFTAVLATNPIGAVVVGITALAAGAVALVKVFGEESEATKKTQEELKKLKEESDALSASCNEAKNAFENNSRELKNEAKITKNLSDELLDLMKSEKKTTEQKARIIGITQQLNAVTGDLNLVYDAEKDSLNMTEKALRDYIKAQQDAAQLQAMTEYSVDLYKQKFDIENQLEKVEKKRLDTSRDSFKSSNNYTKAMISLLAEEKRLKTQLEDTANAIETVNKKQGEYAETVQKTTQAATDAQEKTLAKQEFLAQRQIEIDDAKTQAMIDNADELNVLLEVYEKQYEKIAGTATNMFSKVKTECELSVKDMAENLKYNQETLATWADNFDILSNRWIRGKGNSLVHVSDGLLSNLADMGVEGAGYVAALSTASEAELENLNNIFGKAGNTTIDTTKAIYEKKENQEILKTWAEENAKGFEENAAIEEAVEKKSDNALAILVSKAKDFKNEGVNLGSSAAEGFSDGWIKKIYGINGAVDTINSSLNSVVNAAKKTLDVNSPSKVFAKIGGYMAQGLGIGFVDDMKAVKRQIQAAIPTNFDFAPSVNGAKSGNSIGNSSNNSSANYPITQNVTLNLNVNNELDINRVTDQIYYNLEDLKKRKTYQKGYGFA